MKINYNILWLDDAKPEIEEGEYHTELQEFISDLGFKPQIDIVRTEQEFFEVLDNFEWDLILTDYNLDEIKDNPEKGDQVIEEVRSRNVQTEILFYTKKDDNSRKKGFDRITFIDTSKLSGNVHNEKVLEKAKELIKLTVRKFEDIVAMRGMIMHETSELDLFIIDLLYLLYSMADKKDEFESKIKEKFIESNQKTIEKINDCKNIDELLYIIGATHRWRALMRNTSKGELKSTLNGYESEIIKPRNQFAHAILDDNRVFKTKGGLEFSPDRCKEIREAIIKHKDNLQKLKISIEA